MKSKKVVLTAVLLTVSAAGPQLAQAQQGGVDQEEQKSQHEDGSDGSGEQISLDALLQRKLVMRQAAEKKEQELVQGRIEGKANYRTHTWAPGRYIVQGNHNGISLAPRAYETPDGKFDRRAEMVAEQPFESTGRLISVAQRGVNRRKLSQKNTLSTEQSSQLKFIQAQRAKSEKIDQARDQTFSVETEEGTPEVTVQALDSFRKFSKDGKIDLDAIRTAHAAEVEALDDNEAALNRVKTFKQGTNPMAQVAESKFKHGQTVKTAQKLASTFGNEKEIGKEISKNKKEISRLANLIAKFEKEEKANRTSEGGYQESLEARAVLADTIGDAKARLEAQTDNRLTSEAYSLNGKSKIAKAIIKAKLALSRRPKSERDQLDTIAKAEKRLAKLDKEIAPVAKTLAQFHAVQDALTNGAALRPTHSVVGNCLVRAKTKIKNAAAKVFGSRDAYEQGVAGLKNQNALMLAILAGQGGESLEQANESGVLCVRNNPVYKLATESRFLNDQDADGNTALIHAVQMGDTASLRLLTLVSAYGKADVNKANKDGDTALHLVQTANQVEILANNKANLNAKNEAGMTPLHQAIAMGNLEVVEALVKAGADLSIKNKEINAKGKVVTGKTATGQAEVLAQNTSGTPEEREIASQIHSILVDREIQKAAQDAHNAKLSTKMAKLKRSATGTYYSVKNSAGSKLSGAGASISNNLSTASRAMAQGVRSVKSKMTIRSQERPAAQQVEQDNEQDFEVVAPAPTKGARVKAFFKGLGQSISAKAAAAKASMRAKLSRNRDAAPKAKRRAKLVQDRNAGNAAYSRLSQQRHLPRGLYDGQDDDSAM